MLTLILLVVLGGGAGLMAVWLVDARGLSGLLGRFGWRSLRPTRQTDTTRTEPAAVVDGPRPARFEPLLPTRPEPPAEPVSAEQVAARAPTAVVTYEPVQAPAEPLLEPTGRRNGGRVPAAYTAVEGTYRDVARVPLWRKLVSLASLLGVLVLVAVAIAALAGATFGAIAQLVDGAVG